MFYILMKFLQYYTFRVLLKIYRSHSDYSRFSFLCKFTDDPIVIDKFQQRSKTRLL